MYVGTDGLAKTGISSVIDSIEFTFGIKPESIPYSTKYGVRINTIKGLVSESAMTACSLAIRNLGIPNLTLTSTNVNELKREVTVNLTYKDTVITKVTNYNIGG